MRLGLNFKNGQRKVFTEQETQIILKNMNYMKLLKIITDTTAAQGETIEILGRAVPVEHIHSIEFIL